VSNDVEKKEEMTLFGVQLN